MGKLCKVLLTSIIVFNMQPSPVNEVTSDLESLKFKVNSINKDKKGGERDIGPKEVNVDFKE